MSGLTSPERKWRSHVPSRVFLPGTGRRTGREADGGGGDRRRRLEGGSSPPSFACGSGWSPSPVGGGAAFSRDSGLIVAATLDHSSASSGLSGRNREHAFGDED